MLSRAGYPGSVGMSERPSSLFDPATNALLARMTTQPDATRAGLIDTLIVALKTGGIWDKLDVLHILAAHTSQAALLNWKGATFDASVVLTPTFTTDRGYVTNGTDNAVAWGINQNGGTQFVQNSAYFGVWSGTVASTTASPFGTSTTGNITLHPRNAANSTTARLNGTTRSDGPTTTTSGAGLTAANRLDASTIQLRKNGVQIGTNFTNASAALAATPLRSGHNNSTFVAIDVRAHVLGAQLSSTEDLALYNALNAYMTAVGAA